MTQNRIKKAQILRFQPEYGGRNVDPAYFGLNRLIGPILGVCTVFQPTLGVWAVSGPILGLFWQYLGLYWAYLVRTWAYIGPILKGFQSSLMRVKTRTEDYSIGLF